MVGLASKKSAPDTKAPELMGSFTGVLQSIGGSNKSEGIEGCGVN